jgi:hypothetical protein
MVSQKDSSGSDSMHDLNILIFSIVAVIGIIAILLFVLVLSKGAGAGTSSAGAAAGSAYSVLSEQSSTVSIGKEGSIYIYTKDGTLKGDCYCPQNACPDCKIRLKPQ